MPTITNRAFTGGSPDLPEGAGDVYRIQDMVRDQHFLEEAAARAALDALGRPEATHAIVYGGQVTQGTGDTLNITALRGYTYPTVKVPDSYASNPPTVTTEGVLKRLVFPGVTNQAIAAATLDGATVNYVKLKWTDAGTGGTRSRVKASGTWTYEEVPSYTLTVSSAAAGADEVVLATVVGSAGGTFTIVQDYTNRLTPSSLKTGTINAAAGVGLSPTGTAQAAGIEFVGTPPMLTSPTGSNGFGSGSICWISETRFAVAEDETGQSCSVRVGEVDWSAGTLSWATDRLTIGTAFASNIVVCPIYQDDYFAVAYIGSGEKTPKIGVWYYNGTTTIQVAQALTTLKTAGTGTDYTLALAVPHPADPTIGCVLYTNGDVSVYARFFKYNGTWTLGAEFDTTVNGPTYPGKDAAVSKETKVAIAFLTDTLVGAVWLYNDGTSKMQGFYAELSDLTIDAQNIVNFYADATTEAGTLEQWDIIRTGQGRVRVLIQNDPTTSQTSLGWIDVTIRGWEANTGVFFMTTDQHNSYLNAGEWLTSPDNIIQDVRWVTPDVFAIGYTDGTLGTRCLLFFIRPDGAVDLIGEVADSSYTGTGAGQAHMIGRTNYNQRGAFLYYYGEDGSNVPYNVNVGRITLPLVISKSTEHTSGAFDWNYESARQGEIVYASGATFQPGESVHLLMDAAQLGAVQGESAGNTVVPRMVVGKAITEKHFIVQLPHMT